MASVSKITSTDASFSFISLIFMQLLTHNDTLYNWTSFRGKVSFGIYQSNSESVRVQLTFWI